MKKRRLQHQFHLAYQRQCRLTPNGHGILLAVFFVVLASPIVPAFGVLTCLAALLLIAGVVGFCNRPRVRIETDLPMQICAGDRVTLSYRIENISGMRTFHLTLELPDLPESFLCLEEAPTISCLHPKETVQVDVELAPQRRGRYELSQPVCTSTFPFHLFSYGTKQTGKTHLTVLPAFDHMGINEAVSDVQIRHNVSLPVHAQGSSLEYASNRPFVSGDALRSIDSRAWARLAKPVVKEFHHEIYRHVAIVLSTAGHVSARPPVTVAEDALEAAVSLCASIAYSLDVNTAVDYLAVDTNLYDLSSFAKRDRVAYIHHILAGATSSGKTISLDDDLFEHLIDLPELFVVCLAPDPEMGRMLKSAQCAGCRVNTLVVSPARPDHKTLREDWPCDSQWLSPNRILTKRVKQL